MRKAVVFCVDQKYLPYALFLARQLDHKEPARDYDICMVSDAHLQIPDSFADLNLKCPAPVKDAGYEGLKVSHLARSTYLRM